MNLIKRIAGRVKKFIVAIIALPLILGLVGYFMPKGSVAPSNYTATVTISTGNYGEAKYNNAKQVPLLLKNEAFLKDIFPDMPEEDLAQLKDDLAIEIRTDSLFNLSYTGPDKQETLDTLGKIKDAYMKGDKALFSKEKKSLKRILRRLKTKQSALIPKLTNSGFCMSLKQASLI